MLLVNTRLTFISADVWHKHLPNSQCFFQTLKYYIIALQQLTDQGLQILRETEQDYMRLSLIQPYEILCN